MRVVVRQGFYCSVNDLDLVEFDVSADKSSTECENA